MSDKPQRITLSRRKGWRMPPNTVKVCRPGKWGNPFKVGQPGITTAEEAVERFRAVYETPEFCLIRDEVRRELCGKNLACWCKQDSPCHADILLKLANAK